MDEYASFARIYDPIIGPFLRSAHRSMAGTLKKHGCTTVVDLCCGTGLFAAIASEHGLTPTGVDISAHMLGVARRKYPSTTFIQCDATDLPSEDNSFDAATVSFGLHEKPEPVALAIFSEAMRVTRPGGVVVVADYRIPKYLHTRWMDTAIGLVEWLAGRDHCACYEEYMRAGGSAAFLDRAGVTWELVRTFMHGRAGLYIVDVQ